MTAKHDSSMLQPHHTFGGRRHSEVQSSGGVAMSLLGGFARKQVEQHPHDMCQRLGSPSLLGAQQHSNPVLVLGLWVCC